MTRIQTLPFLIPPTECVSTSGWMRSVDGTFREAEESIPDWDPALSIHASISIDVDIPSILNYCNLGPGSKLRAGTSWHSPGTGLRARGSYIDLSGDETSSRFELDLHIDGSIISQSVMLICDLILLENSGEGYALSPKHHGSLLWRFDHFIQLEGDQTRFPIELVNFKETLHLPNNAVWYLEWDDLNFHQLVLGGMRLLVNSSLPRVREAVVADPGSEEAIRNSIYFDVAFMMITVALLNTEFVNGADIYPEGTVGAALRRLIQTLYIDESFQSLRNSLEESPDQFQCGLQDKLKLFSE